MTFLLQTAEDRGIAVPSGAKIATGYVRIEQIILGCRDRMAIGDVERAMRRRMCIAPAQPWPCPVGAWADGRFIVHDGRHDVVAALMLGVEHVLVAWLDEAAPPA